MATYPAIHGRLGGTDARFPNDVRRRESRAGIRPSASQSQADASHEENGERDNDRRAGRAKANQNGYPDGGGNYQEERAHDLEPNAV
jgi:hypothetical protein